MKGWGYLLLAAVTVAGLWGIGTAIVEGHAAVNTTQHVPWGLWVAIYIFFLGLSAGSFLLSTLVYVFRVRRLNGAGPVALLQALGCLLLGGFLIIIDLGHPERAYKVMTSMNPTSVMAWMGIFYIAYVVIVLVELYLALRPRLVARSQNSTLCRLLTLGYTRVDDTTATRDAWWLRLLGSVGIPVAVILPCGVGSLFAVAKARPGWFSGLFPIIFLITALASAGALLSFLMAAFSQLEAGKRRSLVQDLARLSFGILCFDFLLLVSEVLVTLYGNVPYESMAWKLTLFGPYWWVFWIVQLSGGFVLPLILISTPRFRASLAALGSAGFLMVVGTLGARLNLVIPAQIQPAFPGLADAYHHERWLTGYFPSATEWLVGFGTIAIGTWLFLLAKKVLPLEETT